MKKRILLLLLTLVLLTLTACGSKGKSGSSDGKNDEIKGKIVIYTSMYEDIIDNLKEKLKEEFPNLEVEFFQGGTGTLQSKIVAEMQANKLGADMLMVAEPSYSLELKEKGVLHAYISKNAENLAKQKAVVESGSVAVTKLETGEAAQIMILEESILKKRQEENSKLEVIYPTDGIIAIPSTIMTVKEEMSPNKNIKAAEALTDWFLSPAGQEAIVDGWMHSVLKNPAKAPFDAKSTAEILAAAMPINWDKTYHDRDKLREIFEKYITKAAK